MIRVIPRDLFNEAKLLNNLGRIQILIEDRMICLTSKMDIDDAVSPEGFGVDQDDSDASLFARNLRFYFEGEEIKMRTPYNSKAKYPILGVYKGEDYYLLDDKGNWLPEWGRYGKL